LAFLLDRLIPSSLQVLVNITEYLSEDRYGKWLKVEGNGEEAKFWCWVCHQYSGAKDLLGTSKTLPACEEKLSIHDKHAEHINAFKRHLASLNPKGTIQQALTVIPVAEEDMNTLRCISWLIDHKMSAQQHTKDLVALLRQLGVATRDEKARNNHLSKKSVKQMVHEGGKELRESEGTHGIFADKDWLWAMKENFPRGMPISKGMGA
jgi:hypothetical protein